MQVRLSKQGGAVVVAETKVAHGIQGEALGNVDFGGPATSVILGEDDSLQVRLCGESDGDRLIC